MFAVVDTAVAAAVAAAEGDSFFLGGGVLRWGEVSEVRAHDLDGTRGLRHNHGKHERHDSTRCTSHTL